MITIKVKGQPLFIPSDTVLVLEQSNSIFDEDGITTDIVWQFEIPAQPNQRVLGSAQFMAVGNARRYDCELLLDGVVCSRGELYIEGSMDEKTLQCGIVANAFGVGFGEKRMSENHYAEDITISDSQQQHKEQWLQFLESSLKAESVVKFFLFADDSFYRQNEDFGYHLGQPSGIDNIALEDQFLHYVNRLFVGSDGKVISHPDKDGNGALIKQGLRVFNSASSGKQNGYCFAPAIRLDWLVRRLLQSAGMQVSGSFFANKDIHRLFLQSLNALDGDVFQYGIETKLEVNGITNRYSDSLPTSQPFISGGSTFNSFGWSGTPNFAFKALLPRDELQHKAESIQSISNIDGGRYSFKAKKTDEIFAFCIRTASAWRPNLRMSKGWKDGSGSKVFMYGRWPTIGELVDRADITTNTITDIKFTGGGNCRLWYHGALGPFTPMSTHSFQFVTETGSMLIQLTKSTSNNIYYTGELGGYTESNVTPGWHPSAWTPTTKLYIELVKCTIGSTNEGLNPMAGDIMRGIDVAMHGMEMETDGWGSVESITNYEVLESLAIDSTDIPLNIFSNIMRWSDHVPDLSNGEFLSRISKMFGLSLFANPVSREVQLSFFADTLKGNCFDISQWVAKRERLEYTPKRMEVSISPALGTREVNEKNVISPATSANSLPIAATCKGKHIFIENEKAYRRSTKETDTSRFSWEQAGGDNHKLTAGAKDAKEVENVAIEGNIPNMKWVEEKRTPHYLCEVPVSGCSPLMDESYDGKFPLVLQQYRGRRALALQTTAPITEAFIEDANPTIYDKDGNIVDESISLSASGKDSIGERWLRPAYDIIGNHDTYRVTAHLPTWAWLRVISTLQPQQGTAQSQTRWLYIDGLKVMPTKISSELSARESVICTIEAVSPHMEI